LAKGYSALFWGNVRKIDSIHVLPFAAEVEEDRIEHALSEGCRYVAAEVCSDLESGPALLGGAQLSERHDIRSPADPSPEVNV
jgi:hypothetical protein